MEYIVSAIIAVVVLSLFLFVALKGAVKRMNNNAKKYSEINQRLANWSATCLLQPASQELILSF